jgi:hypothetical protein
VIGLNDPKVKPESKAILLGEPIDWGEERDVFVPDEVILALKGEMRKYIKMRSNPANSLFFVENTLCLIFSKFLFE